jgi:hypothetical protein
MPIPRLERRKAPVVARDHTTTERRTTTAGHRESRGSRLCAVINGQLFADVNGLSCGDLKRTHMPQVGIAAVVAEVDHACCGQHKVGVLVDREGVHVSM